MENKPIFFEKFCDVYKRRIEALVELENQEENEEEDSNREERHTLTLLLADLCRMEDYCEDPDQMRQTYEDLQQKVDDIIFVLGEMEKRQNALKEQIESLEKTRKTLENKHKNLSRYLMDSLRGCQFTKFATDKYQLTIKKSTALEISEDVTEFRLSDLDFARYIRSKTTLSWDKNKIKEDMKLDRLPESVKEVVKFSDDYNMSIKNRT